MTKPLFAVLKANHMGSDYKAAQVYEALGLPSSLADDPTWANTCAIRMSVALIGAGIAVRPGSLTIKTGRFQGKVVQASQRKLSEFLLEELGEPERYPSGFEAHKAIGLRRGIVSFFRIAGGGQGHIDLVSAADWAEVCSAHCYWDAGEVWFWPLH